jgi:predicted HD phosphohydrolase
MEVMTAQIDGVEPFRSMEDATPSQLKRYISDGSAYFKEHTVTTLLRLLELGKGADFGAGVDRYVHSLQTATRAYRANARIDMVVGALLHDVADSFAVMNHAAVAAAILSKYVDEETTWVIEHHTVFQGYHFWDKIGLDKDARNRWAAHPYFDATAVFCAEWDSVSFDETYNNLPVEFFIPALEEVFSRPANGMSLNNPADRS